jgi:C4-dicarboxylate-specific signal transduction histidine kinase
MLGFDSAQEMIANTRDIGQQHYVQQERRTEFKQHLETHGTVRDFVVEMHRHGGGRIWISLSARAVCTPGGELLYYEGTAVDITERKQAQEALQQAHEELERRVEERTRELNQANRELNAEVASRRKAQEELEVMQQQLVEASRQAGMAELATGILHNVGNVITSINISSALVSDRVSKSRVSSVSKAAALMQAHANDLPGFFANDPRGKKLMEFLSSLASHLAQEQKTILDELASLRGSVEHIKEIVTMQQGCAKSAGAREPVAASDLLEQALRMNAATLEHHQVQVTREYSQAPPVHVEKHKVLQILVNLIRNAQHALDDREAATRRMTLRIADNGDNTAGISVIDNGVGIPAENLNRLFEHGFTTRKDGHGFGLNSGARAARELGGTLTAHSDGPGKGARFTLTLPCQPDNKPAA